MKNLKKIISVFVLCMMLLSLGICSASETESDFGIIETNGTSKSVYVEFNEPVSLDSEQIQFSLSDETGNDIAISKTVLSDDKKRVNIIFENPITVFANETKKVNIKVHNISNEDSTKIYIGGEASVTYTGIYFDNFDNYTDIAELDNEFQIVGNYNWATQKFQNCPNNFSFEDDDNGGKKLKITGMAPVWGIQHKYATNWNQNKKNYTVEVDMQSSTEDNKRFGFCINQYDLGYGGIISVTFKKQLIDFSTGGNRLMQDVALENVAITSDEKYSVAMSMKPSCDQTADIMDIYYNGENKAHAKGTVKLSNCIRQPRRLITLQQRFLKFRILTLKLRANLMKIKQSFVNICR